MKQAGGTILSRVFITLMGLFTTMVAGHRLGAAGLGDISLIVLGITVIMLLNNVVGGGALVYFTPRVPSKALMVPAYGWLLLTVAAGAALLWLVPVVPERFRSGVLTLAAIQGVYTIHLNVLLGQQRIAAFNLITAAQAAVLLIAFLFVNGLNEIPTSQEYVLASFMAFVFTALVSTLAVFTVPARRRKNAPAPENTHGLLRKLMRQGGLTQGANALQLLNYRLAYWLIERFHGVAPLGVYSVAVQLAESSWIAPRGLGMVLYSKASNSEDAVRQRELTLTTFKASVFFALVVLIAVLLIPDELVRSLFGREVGGLVPLIALLSPGILAMAASQAFSHYFSGTARNRHNTIGSGIGLVATLAFGLVLVPRYGLHGAAITATIAYCSNCAYQGWWFMKLTGTGAIDLLPHAGDVARVASLLRSLRP